MSYDNWIEYKLSDVVSTVSDTYKFDKTQKVTLINTSDVLGGKVLKHLKEYPLKVAGQFKKRFNKDDILYSEIRPANRRYAYIDFNSEHYVASTKLMVLRKKNDLINNKFLFQFLTSYETLSELQELAESRSGTFPQITFTQLSNLSIKLPSISEQKAIANILSSLDDKIETNNKINQQLETLAQLLYKQWFVDFEFPNQVGLPYKSSGGKMVESELGLIPEKWAVIELGDIINNLREKSFPAKEQRLLDLSSMPSYSLSLDKYKDGDTLKTNLFLMNKGNLLYGSIRPYLGKFGIAPFNGLSTGTIHQYLPREHSDYSFVAMTTFSKEFNEFCIKLSGGTKMPVINWENFSSFKFSFNNTISCKFNNIIEPMLSMILRNINEIIELSKTRDLLLPKLMSGELRVPIEE